MVGFPKPTRGAGLLDRHERRKARDKALADAYAVVDARDGGVCRASGVYTVPGAPDARVRREHHHLVKRSLSRALRAEPRNIVTLSALAHQLAEGGHLLIEGDDADTPGALRFHWADHTAPASRPFRLASRRRSQRRG